MAVNYSAIAYTLLGFADKFQDFFTNDPQDVTIKCKDCSGDIYTITIPNISKMKQMLNEHGITDDDLNNVLKEHAKLGKNLVFGYGPPKSSIFDSANKVFYVDRNTATIYTKDQNGKIVSNVSLETLNNILKDYIKYNRDIMLGDGKPDSNVPNTVKIYIDTKNENIYIRNTKNKLVLNNCGSKTATPDISGPDSILDTETAKYTIKNYNSSKNTYYNIKTSNGSTKRNGQYIYYYPPATKNDMTVTITVVAKDENSLPSDPVNLTLSVKTTAINEEKDQLLINSDYKKNEYKNDGWNY